MVNVDNVDVGELVLTKAVVVELIVGVDVDEALESIRELVTTVVVFVIAVVAGGVVDAVDEASAIDVGAIVLDAFAVVTLLLPSPTTFESTSCCATD